MIFKSIEGEENISIVINGARDATVGALVKEGLISEEDAKKFLDTHFVMLIDNRGFFKRFFSKEASVTESKILISKIV